MGVTWSAEPH